MIFYSNLRFPVGTEIFQSVIFPQLGHPRAQFVGKHYGERHQFRRFVAGVTHHHALVAGSANAIDLFDDRKAREVSVVDKTGAEEKSAATPAKADEPSGAKGPTGRGTLFRMS